MFFLNGRLYFPRKVLATSRFSHHIAFILFLNNYSYSSSRRHNIKKKNIKKIKKIISKIFWYFMKLLWLRIEHRHYDILYIHMNMNIHIVKKMDDYTVISRVW